jgi:hypothetical protein
MRSFLSDDSVRVFLLSLRTGAAGLTLVRPPARAQHTARSRSPAHVRRLCCGPSYAFRLHAHLWLRLWPRPRAPPASHVQVRANHVFLLEPSLDPAIEQQAVARVHRIGQAREVRGSGWQPGPGAAAGGRWRAEGSWEGRREGQGERLWRPVCVRPQVTVTRLLVDGTIEGSVMQMLRVRHARAARRRRGAGGQRVHRSGLRGAPAPTSRCAVAAACSWPQEKQQLFVESGAAAGGRSSRVPGAKRGALGAELGLRAAGSGGPCA